MFSIGTDRSNLVQMRARDENYPIPYQETTFWQNAKVRWSAMARSTANIKSDDLALYFASSGYYRFVILSLSLSLIHIGFADFSCQRSSDCQGTDSAYSYDTLATKLDNLLNNAPASFDGWYFSLSSSISPFFFRRTSTTQSWHVSYDVYTK